MRVAAVSMNGSRGVPWRKRRAGAIDRAGTLVLRGWKPLQPAWQLIRVVMQCLKLPVWSS